ncbi:MAG: aminoacyl-tRNA hydrolase [Leptospirales bacterium]
MWLWVGLGNPGKKYENTRHNIGAIMLRHVAPEYISYSIDKSMNGELAKMKTDEDHLLLIPLTFMNLSGDAVVKTMKYHKIKPDKMVVFHDELELEPLDVRYKFGGGHKGHNGLRDIIQKIGSPDFHRLRIGIGRPPNRDYSVADYVLSRMPKDDIPDRQSVMDILLDNKLPVL